MREVWAGGFLCGLTLICESDRAPGELHFHIGAFDRPEMLAPMAEDYPEERLPWVHLGDLGKAG